MQCPPSDLDQVHFFLIALPLTLLVGLAEVAGAYQDRPQPWRALVNRWAWPLYLFYLLLSFLMGKILLEQGLICPSWTGAVALGLLGPTLLKVQAKLFKPIGGSGREINANLERLVQGVQEFCFSQINASLADRRLQVKARLARLPRERLLGTLRTLYSDQEFQEHIQPLVAAYEAEDPQRLAAGLVDLIEAKDPVQLERLLAEVCKEERGDSG